MKCTFQTSQKAYLDNPDVQLYTNFQYPKVEFMKNDTIHDCQSGYFWLPVSKLNIYLSKLNNRKACFKLLNSLCYLSKILEMSQLLFEWELK